MPAPPPPPPAPTFNLGGGSNDRGALLQSIRDGKRLKKTVTVDKSAPAISGKVCGEPSSTASNASSKAPAPNTNSINNGGPMGLGGLFAGGMPKLKPTGMRSNLAERDNGNSHSNTMGSATLPSVKRGPPPVPPPAAQKPQLFSVNNQSPESSNLNHNETPRSSFGKPTLAPKPPATSSNAVQQQKPSPPPKKLTLSTNNSVSRAQSMRLPRSPQVLAPTPPSLHQSQDCLVEPQQRPTNRPLRPPVARPPSPPTSHRGSSNGGATITRVAPPPPTRAPSMPPPPPPPLPQRSSSSSASSSAAAPPPPLPTATRTAPPMPPPPTPPTRGQSLQQRNGQAQMMSPSPAEFEARFADMFHSIANFPAPEPFRNVQKVYNSKTVAAAKQQAPAPPVRSVSNAGTGGPRQPAPQPWQNAAC